MFQLILLFIALSVPAWAISRHVSLTRARTKANRIINGDEPVTEEQINITITKLLATKNWLQDITEQDRQRVVRLREMRKEMVTPHG